MACCCSLELWSLCSLSHSKQATSSRGWLKAQACSKMKRHGGKKESIPKAKYAFKKRKNEGGTTAHAVIGNGCEQVFQLRDYPNAAGMVAA